MNIRVGLGYDAHRLVKGRPLFLGGVRIPYVKGLEGHSDADVILHAVVVSPWVLGLLVLAPFVVYPFAWSGHFFFEHNKPAAFKNPVWAKASDWVMMYEMLRGRIPF
jgi:hypothetical protein